MDKVLMRLPETDEDTDLSKLPIMQQLQVMANGTKGVEDAQTEAHQAYLAEHNALLADFIELVNTAVLPLIKGEHTSVTLKVSSNFNSVIHEVLDRSKYKTYFNYRIRKGKFPDSTHYHQTIVINVKRSDVNGF